MTCHLREVKERARVDHTAFGFEVKFAPDAADGTFTGYGAAFDNVDDYGDVILPGAFKASLRAAKKSGHWPAMLLQHGFAADGMMPVGIWTDMHEDEKGLYVEGKLALDTQRGKDVHALLKMTPRPALSGLSIGYVPTDFSYGTKPEQPRRTLKAVDLLEVSLVTFPANDLAGISDVKAANNINTIREFESFLRDSGFSIAAAKAIAASGFKAKQPTPRDEDGPSGELVEHLKRLAASIHPNH